MPPSPALACLRRRLLRRYLADAGLDAGQVALAIGVSPEYFAKMLAGSRVLTDAVCWRLLTVCGLPLPPLAHEPHFCADAPAASCRYQKQ